MSVPCGRRSPEPFAYFDPGCSSARTSQPSLGLGSWSEPSVTFPRWGSMRSGQCFRRPRWEPRTAENGCSSSPGLLPTPTASDRFGAGSHGEGGPDLRTTVSLFPTPKASDGEKGGPNQRGSSGDLTLPSAVMPLLGTPRCADGMQHQLREGVKNPRGRLEDQVSLLSTPRASRGASATESVYLLETDGLTRNGRDIRPLSNDGNDPSGDPPPHLLF